MERAGTGCQRLLEWNRLCLRKTLKTQFVCGRGQDQLARHIPAKSSESGKAGCAVDFSFSFRLLWLLYLLSWCGIYSFLDSLGGRVFEADLLLVPTRLLAAHRRVVQHCHRLVIAATWQMQLDLEPCSTDFLAVASI